MMNDNKRIGIETMLGNKKITELKTKVKNSIFISKEKLYNTNIIVINYPEDFYPLIIIADNENNIKENTNILEYHKIEKIGDCHYNVFIKKSIYSGKASALDSLLKMERQRYYDYLLYQMKITAYALPTEPQIIDIDKLNNSNF